jgi:hypothetical protein
MSDALKKLYFMQLGEHNVNSSWMRKEVCSPIIRCRNFKKLFKKID